MIDLPSMPIRPIQFRMGHSSLHGLGAGWKLLLATGIGALGLSLSSLPLLTALLMLVGSGYAWATLSIAELWKDLRWLLVQSVLVVLATLVLRRADPVLDGCRTGLQLVLVFLPVALLLRTTPSDAIHEPLRRWLPERLAFAFGATLRFLPMFTREGAELIEMQRMRGARLAVGQLRRPGAWRDWLACVALPMTVRAIEIAEEAADAAEIRGVGATDFAAAQQVHEAYEEST